MTRFSPLPRVDLDPRNETEIVNESAKRVYQASGGAINDFSSGSPLLALLEGQAFAQSELLFWMNQLPDKILVDWIGPFLGAQRKLGESSQVNLRFEINPRSTRFVIGQGFIVSTDPNLTNGVSIEFVTEADLVIPPGSSFGEVTASSVTTGEITNVPSETITSFSEPLVDLVSVTNFEPSFGGEDFETLDEVKERFFSLINRRNPVSAEDWRGLMEDILGQGTQTVVIPRRSSFEGFNDSPGHFSLFSLNPDGSELTSLQIESAQEIIDNKTPISIKGHLFSSKVFPVEANIDLTFDPSLPYSRSLENLANQIRELLIRSLTPGRVFPIEYSPSVTDIESSLTELFPTVFNSPNRYITPDINSLQLFSPPEQLSENSFRILKPLGYSQGELIQENDLVDGFEALSSFNINLSTKESYVNRGNLRLKRIKLLESGTFLLGDIVAVQNINSFDLHIVLNSGVINFNNNLSELISEGILSPSISFSNWVVGQDYTNLELIEAEQSDFSNNLFEPSQVFLEPLSVRPGWFVFIVENSFTRESISTLSESQAQNLIGNTTVNVLSIVDLQNYISGEFFSTPEIIEQPCPYSPNIFYNDPELGVLQKTYKVLQDFQFNLGTLNLKDYLDSLENSEIIKEVNVYSFSNVESFKYLRRL